MLTLGKLAAELNVQYKGDSTIELHGIRSLQKCAPAHLSFVIGEHNIPSDCPAVLVITPQRAQTYTGPCLIHHNPRWVFARAAVFIHPRPNPLPGIADSACVADTARIAASARIGESVIVENGAIIGERVNIDAHCFIGQGVCIEADTYLGPQVTIYRQCHIGQRCYFSAGAVVGSPGFGWTNSDESNWTIFPQCGRVRIGNDVNIGANTNIDRGALDDTVIGNDVKIDNGVHIAHNVHVGDHTVLAASVAIAGSSKIGQCCVIGGNATVTDNIQIADRVTVIGHSAVATSITQSGIYSSTINAHPHIQWKRIQVYWKRLHDFMRRQSKKISK